jgi:hypothetical protein
MLGPAMSTVYVSKLCSHVSPMGGDQGFLFNTLIAVSWGEKGGQHGPCRRPAGVYEGGTRSRSESGSPFLSCSTVWHTEPRTPVHRSGSSSRPPTLPENRRFGKLSLSSSSSSSEPWEPPVPADAEGTPSGLRGMWWLLKQAAETPPRIQLPSTVRGQEFGGPFFMYLYRYRSGAKEGRKEGIFVGVKCVCGREWGAPTVSMSAWK